MKFSRAVVVAAKILVTNFILGLILGFLLLREGLLVSIVFVFLSAIFSLALVVYFILEEAEKMSLDRKNFDVQIRELRRKIREISGISREVAGEAGAQKQCPKCGRDVAEGFRMCPYCGFDWT